MNKKTILIVAICSFLISPNLFSNQDSLKTVLNTSISSEEKLGIAYEIAKLTLFNKPDTATKYLFLALEDSAQNSWSINLANCLNAIGIYYFYRSQYDSTIYYSSRSLNIFIHNGDTASSIKPQKNIALAQRSKGDYKLALTSFFKILAFYKTIKNSSKIAATLNDIGNTYSYLEDDRQAIKYQYEALTYLESETNHRLEGNIYNSFGFIYNNLGKVDSAIMYYEKSLLLKQKSGNLYSIINTRNNICTLIDFKKDPKKCEDCLLELLKDQRKVDDLQGLARTFLNLSVQYSYYNECDRAIRNFDSTAHYLSFTDDIFFKQHYFEFYSKTLKQCGKYELAYKYKDSLLILNDSIFQFQKQKEIFDLDTKYQTQQKIESIKMLETKNANNKLKVEKQRWQIFFLIFSLITFVGGGILFFFLFKQRRQKLEELAILKMREKERVRIARDMHDEIGSGLTRISFMSEQIKLLSATDKNTEGISKVIEQSRNLSKNLREIIWAIDPGNDKLSELLFYLRDYVNDFSSNTEISCKIEFPEDFEEIVLAAETRRNIFLALKEMLHNITKHANADVVYVSFYLSNNLGLLIVKDDGCGFNEESVKKGLGLESIKLRAEKLGGLFKLESKINHGTTISLEQIILNTTKV